MCTFCCSQKLHMQENVADAFVRTFQLTPEEVSVIKGSTRESPITQEFFVVLEKTQKIRNSTKYLLQVSKRDCMKTAKVAQPNFVKFCLICEVPCLLKNLFGFSRLKASS